MKSKPLSTNRSRIAKDAASSAVQPKTLPPRQNGATVRSERPMRRLSMRVNPAGKGLDTRLRTEGAGRSVAGDEGDVVAQRQDLVLDGAG